MDTVILTNGPVFDGETLHENLSVIVENGRVTELTANAPQGASQQLHDLQGRLLAPGLVDLQVNGGGGVLFNAAPGVDSIRRIGEAHWSFGTTGFLPTLISSDAATMRRAVIAVRDAIAAGVPGVLGIHLEGPFLSAERCGVHDPAVFRIPAEEDFELFQQLDNGRVLLTVAPEVVGGNVIRRLADSGVTVFAGHSAANYGQVRTALDAGLHGFTHLFNAMTPLTSREPGMVGAALEDESSYAGIICDGHHVHPASFAMAAAAKRFGRLVLVTDAMATVGAPGHSFEWNGETVAVKNGSCRLPDDSLAGSNLDMISAVRNAMAFAGLDRFEALQMASTFPAQAIGLGDEIGYIRPGYRASFVELDADMCLQGTWIDGVRRGAGGMQP